MNPIASFFNSVVGSTSSGVPLQPVLSAPCPPGWSAHWSPDYRRFYYVEAATGQRLWNPPSHIPYSANNYCPPSPVVNASGASPQLPPGWVSQHSHEYNRLFYVNTATGESQWTPPSAFNASPAPPPPSPRPPAAQIPPSHIVAAPAFILPHTAIPSPYPSPVQLQPSAGPLPATPGRFRPSANPPGHLTPSATQAAWKAQQTQLPPGWIASFDNAHQRFVYTNANTGEVSWTPPFASTHTRPLPLPPGSTRPLPSQPFSSSSSSAGGEPQLLQQYESATTEKARLHAQEYHVEQTGQGGSPCVEQLELSFVAAPIMSADTKEPEVWECVPDAPPPAYEPFDPSVLATADSPVAPDRTGQR
ncbi:hypothetical protein BC830DRAFT_1174982 [Chytriomyces sp. MP71]|nr:hypothetical protein BC830DRAFT_1174982 [Chytriomyces sp. MP71]